MALKTNKLLFIIVPLVLFLVIAVILMSTGGESDAVNKEDESPLVLTQEELQLLGVEGDTPRDTVATLVGQVNVLRQQTKDALDESAELREQNKKLAERSASIDSQIQRAIELERSRSVSDSEGFSKDAFQSLQKQIDFLSNNQTKTEIPIGLGLDGSTGLVWVEPLDAKEKTDGAFSKTGAPNFPNTFSDEQSSDIFESISNLPSTASGQQEAEPVYTIPKNSTLIGSVAMTALLGRIPINGTVSDPYPFKVIIGADNLTANGIELPEVESAIVSGTASGDWTLSCVRGDVSSITFVFYDGTIRTLPSSSQQAAQSVGSAMGASESEKSSIGWLSDPQGLPCVYGERKTNAREFLLTSFILSAAGAASSAYAGSEVTTIAGADSVTSSVTGSKGKYVAGEAVSSGVDDVRQWVTDRFGQTFDAIYVPPGQRVAIHIDQELAIDYEFKGRKVRYENATISRNLP